MSQVGGPKPKGSFGGHSEEAQPQFWISPHNSLLGLGPLLPWWARCHESGPGGVKAWKPGSLLSLGPFQTEHDLICGSENRDTMSSIRARGQVLEL